MRKEEFGEAHREKVGKKIECITKKKLRRKKKTSTTTKSTSLLSYSFQRRCSSPPSVVRAQAASAAENTANKNKTVLITGANTGIGLVAAKELASRGGFDIVLGCRDAAKARAALAAVRAAAAPGTSVSLPNNDSALLDLSSLQSVKDFSAAVLDSGRPLNVLLNNAGVMALPTREETADGFEYQLGVNHLGHAALTWRLLPLLLDTAVEDGRGTEKEAVRVVTVASSAHQFGKICFADLNFRESPYSAWGAYGQSKLANVLFAYELARRTAGSSPGSTRFTSNALHPGVVKTELARYLFGELFCFISFVLVFFAPEFLGKKEKNAFSLSPPLSFFHLPTNTQTRTPRGPWGSSRPSSPAPS